MKICLSIAFLFVFFQGSAQQNPKRIFYDDAWSKEDFKKANTAKFAFYLSRKSKESIRLINLARLNGPLFIETYVRNYLKTQGINIDSLDEKKDRVYIGFLRDLQGNKNLPKLRPSFSLHLSASFHAITSGFSGYVGHDKPFSFKARFLLFGNLNPFIAENCDYGNRYPLPAVMELLIDKGITGAGHRKNMLNKNLKRIGCSFKPHKGYEYNYVQDFSSGNLFERIFKKK
jgi:hypothetical protein